MGEHILDRIVGKKVEVSYAGNGRLYHNIGDFTGHDSDVVVIKGEEEHERIIFKHNVIEINVSKLNNSAEKEIKSFEEFLRDL